MNIKRIFGSILTGLGICALIYASILFVNTSNEGTRDIKILITYTVICIRPNAGVMFAG